MVGKLPWNIFGVLLFVVRLSSITSFSLCSLKWEKNWVRKCSFSGFIGDRRGEKPTFEKKDIEAMVSGTI